jgi:hypothetical protein
VTRQRSIRRFVVGVVVAATAAAAVATPAAAATLSLPDEKGDAVPAVDITRLVIRNDPGFVRVRAVIPQLKPARVAETIAALRVRGPGEQAANYVVITERTTAGRQTTLWRAPFASEVPPGEKPIACPGLTVRWIKSSRAVVTVPSSCLATTARVKAGFYIERVDAQRARHTDWAPGRYASLSPWVPRG